MSTHAASVGAQSAQTRPAWLRPWLTRETLAAWLFILPSLVGFLVFYAIPADRVTNISLTDWDLLSEATFVGVENYRSLLEDSAFFHALWVTLYYVLLNIPLQTVLGPMIAFVLDRFVGGVGFRSLLILPWLVPNVVVALLFL